MDDWESQLVPAQAQDDDWEAQLRPAGKEPSATEAVARGALQGATFGFSDEAGGSVQSLLQRLANVAPKGSLEWAGIENRYPEDPSTTYRDARDDDRAANVAADEAHPLAYGAGNVAGGVASGLLLPGGATATVGRTLATGAGVGALQGAGSAGELEDVPGAMAVGGGIGLAAGGAGHLIGKGIKAAPAALKDFAEKRAVKAAGPMLKDVRGMARAGKLNEIGRDLLDNDVVTFGASLDTIAGRTGALKEKAGQQLGEARSLLDGLANRGERFNPTNAADRIERELIAPLRGAPVYTSIAKQLQAEADNLRALGNKGMTFGKAAELKGTYDQFLNHDVQQTPLKEMMKRFRGILNAEMNDAAEAIATRADPSVLPPMKEANRLYGNMARVGEFADDQLSRREANRFLSPSDQGVGVVAALGTASPIGGAAVAGGHKVLRERGASMVAATANTISKRIARLSTTSPGKLGKWAVHFKPQGKPALSEQEIGVKHHVLAQTDPAYSEHMRALAAAETGEEDNQEQP